MKPYLLLFLLFSCGLTYGQNFYDQGTIQTIEIEFAQNNWDQILDAAKDAGTYTMATTVTINGVEMDSVGVKYKGNSTYNPNQTKNPFHIELDTYKEHSYNGYKDIKLSNVAKDPSFLREVLSYHILRQYMDAPESNYANVYVNGTLLGLYSNSEAITKTFVRDRFYSKDNTFIKCNPPAGAGPQSNDFPNLEYLGTDSTSYYDAYELKSDHGWDELIHLCDTLTNHVDAIEEILDVDRALWMLAYDNALVNLDSYIGRFAQNYYLYRDDNGRFVPVVWDLNESFGRFSDTGSGNLNGTTAKQRMDHLLHDNDNDFPLTQKLLSVPMYKRMYLAHFKTIMLENFDNGSYYTHGETLMNLIDAAVQADNNKFFTYNNFLDNLDTDVAGGGGGPGGGGTIGIASLMDGRSDYLLALSDFTQLQPTISDISLSNDMPIISETISLTAKVDDGNVAYLGYRSNIADAFERLEMYDDGMHDDGAANDGVYGVEVAIENFTTQYYIYAENANAGKFSPVRAEHEYHTINATMTNPSLDEVVINEFMASNDNVQADQDGEYDDWIELYNNSTMSVDLTGYFMSDDPSDLMKWGFPNGATIAAAGYLMIWADSDTAQDGLHANFKLSASGEQIFLVDPSGAIVDELSYVDQITDVSYGRFPNGTGPFQTMVPTFNMENVGTSSTSDITTDISLLKAYPNPATDQFNIVYEGTEVRDKPLYIYNVYGKVILKGILAKEQLIGTSRWAAGVYVIRVEDEVYRVVIE